MKSLFSSHLIHPYGVERVSPWRDGSGEGGSNMGASGGDGGGFGDPFGRANALWAVRPGEICRRSCLTVGYRISPCLSDMTANLAWDHEIFTCEVSFNPSEIHNFKYR